VPAIFIGAYNPVAAYALLFVVAALLTPRIAAQFQVNTLGTLATNLIVQRALELVFTKRPILNSIALDLLNREGGGGGPVGTPIAAYNTSVLTRTFNVPAVGNFGDAAAARNDLDVSVTLNNFKQVYYVFTPAEYSGTSRNIPQEAAEPMAIAIANHMVDAVAALWTIANYATAPITLGAGWDYDHLVNVCKVQNQQGVPDFSRFYVCNSDVYASLKTDPRIVAEFNNAQNANAIMTGKLPVVQGLAIQEYPALPNTGNLVAFTGYKGTCAMACRVPRNPNELIPGAQFPGNLGIITEPRTGMSVMVNEWIDALTLEARVRLIWMYGVAVGNENANGSTGRIIKSL